MPERWIPSLEHYIDVAAFLLGADRTAAKSLPRLTLAESALHAPFASFGGVEAYPTLIEQAAVLIEHLARNHPLPDANKRAAFLLAARFLDANGLPWATPNAEIDATMSNASLPAAPSATRSSRGSANEPGRADQPPVGRGALLQASFSLAGRALARWASGRRPLHGARRLTWAVGHGPGIVGTMLRRPGLSTVLLAGGLVLLVLTVLFALRGTGEGDEDAASPPTASDAGEQATPPPEDPTLPPADDPLPTGATALAEQLTAVTRRLRTAIEGYTEAEAQVRLGPSEEIELLALRQQRIYFRLSPREALGDLTVDLLPDDVRAEGRNTLAARRALRRLAQAEPPPQDIQTVLPEAPGQLRRYYNAAEQRTGVSAELLTAVNFVESAFGRLRAEGPDGARGPMQLTPAEWEAYGMGGDIDSPRDSVMAAARLLADAGAPGDPRAALIALRNVPATDETRRSTVV